MLLHFYKYEGAGNDFIIIDSTKHPCHLNTSQIQNLCDRHYGVGSDGLIMLCKDDMADFGMQFFNPDGTSGMMCGNGGRCIAQAAYNIGYIKTNVMTFNAPDGLHFAKIERDDLVSLQMKNVDSVCRYRDGLWLNTGTSHFVVKVEDVGDLDVEKKGAKLRYDKRFIKYGGANIDFYSPIADDEVLIRTYERGVEGETLACGTGIVATAIAYYLNMQGDDDAYQKRKNDNQEIKIHTMHDSLTVKFKYDGTVFSNIILLGKARKVFDGIISINEK